MAMAIFRIFSEQSLSVKFWSRNGSGISLKINGFEWSQKLATPLHSTRGSCNPLDFHTWYRL